MNWDDLRIIAAVKDEGTYAGASARLRIDETLGLVPEISGNRLMVSVRLMRQEGSDKLQPSGENSEFELTLCS